MSRKLTNRYDVVQMGDTPGFWDSISERLDQYLDPNFQRQLKLDKEEKRRYNKQQEQLITQQNYQSDLFKWQEFEKDYNTAIEGADGNPNKIKIINQFWPDKDKIFNIRMPDGSVISQSLPISMSNAVADEELTRKNNHTSLRDEYINPETTRERRMEIYSQVKQTGLDAGMALDSSIDTINKEDKQYESNRQLVDYITSADYLKGTGISVEEAESLKEKLSSGGINDTELGILNDFVTRKTQSQRKTREFWEKLYNKSLETYGDTKIETPPLVRQKLRKLIDIAEKQLEIPSSGALSDFSGGDMTDLGSLTEEEINKYNKAVEDIIGNKEVSDEERISIEEEVYASMFPPMKKKEETKKPPEPPKESWWDKITQKKAGISRMEVMNWVFKEDDLQIKNRKGKITNPFISLKKKSKVLKDPISGKSVNRDTLLKNIKNNPFKYASKGYVYDPTNVKSYIDFDNETEKEFLIGYRKMSPKEALQTLNAGQSISLNQPRRLEIE